MKERRGLLLGVPWQVLTAGLKAVETLPGEVTWAERINQRLPGLIGWDVQGTKKWMCKELWLEQRRQGEEQEPRLGGGQLDPLRPFCLRHW